MILSFAFAGLFLVGNNVFGGVGDLVDVPPAITCGQYSGACWTVAPHSNCACIWVGVMGTHCVPC